MTTTHKPYQCDDCGKTTTLAVCDDCQKARAFDRLNVARLEAFEANWNARRDAAKLVELKAIDYQDVRTQWELDLIREALDLLKAQREAEAERQQLRANALDYFQRGPQPENDMTVGFDRI